MLSVHDYIRSSFPLEDAIVLKLIWYTLFIHSKSPHGTLNNEHTLISWISCWYTDLERKAMVNLLEKEIQISITHL